MCTPSSMGGFIAKSVTGEGNIFAVVPTSEELVMKHGEMKGFMGAMTMGYKVDPPSLLDKLKAGARSALPSTHSRRPPSRSKR